MSTLSPALAAGLVLAAICVLEDHKLPAPTASAALNAIGASRTTAYKAKAGIEAALPDLLRPPGRPAAPPPERPADMDALHGAVVTFLFDHPGAVSGSQARRDYSARFQVFVLELCEAHPEVPLEQLAKAVLVPLPTLKDWLRGERPQVATPVNLATLADPAPARIQAVLDAWERWTNKHRGFRAFCDHVSFHLRIPFGRKHVSDILTAHGVRIPKRRGRPPDASANRGGFLTFYPNAQWVGDGAQLDVHLNGQRITVNLELLVDTHSGAFTGASIRPTEDAAAVTEAFTDGVATTGAPPVALLLDNKPSNHGAEVDAALGDTIRVRSRPYVPTDKPHVEGAFGLFKQEAPPMVLDATTPEQLAMGVAALVVTTWLRAVNHRPRADRDGKKSRVDLFRDAAPTADDIAHARQALLERQRKQEAARQTRQRRQDPVVRALLDAAFARLGLDDPQAHLRIGIASWPLEAVVNGIAIFEGKKKAGTLPNGVDGRYLRGIVKNLAEEAEVWYIAEALLRERLAARDLALAHLGRQRDALEDDADDAPDLVKAFIDKALATTRGIDRTFWLLATADVINDMDLAEHKRLLLLAARRTHATRAVPHDQRLAAVRFLFAKVIVVA